MNEKLTPVEAFENIIVDLTPHLKNANTEEIKIVETALKNEDSEKFELIQQVRELKDDVASLESCNSKLWLENEEYKKALEIIKEKGLHYLEISMLKSNLSYEDYLTEMNITIGVKPMIDSKIKTQEESELLKEIL